MSFVRPNSRRLFARRQPMEHADAPMTVDPEAMHVVAQYANGTQQIQPQHVSQHFIQSLRDAAFAMDVDYETRVAPYFYPLESSNDSSQNPQRSRKSV